MEAHRADYVVSAGTLAAAAVGGTYALWLFFLAAMNLKRVRDAGALHPAALALGTPILLVGWLLDLLVNATVMTLLLAELPRETTVTARLKRHNRQTTGWRKKVAVFFEPLLDPFDPSGDHI